MSRRVTSTEVESAAAAFSRALVAGLPSALPPQLSCSLDVGRTGYIDKVHDSCRREVRVCEYIF